MLNIILVLSIFFSVVLLVRSIFDILDKGAEEYKNRYVSKTSNEFETMFIYLSPNQLFFLNITVTAMFFILAFLIFNGWTFRIIFAGLGFWFPAFLVKFMK